MKTKQTNNQQDWQNKPGAYSSLENFTLTLVVTFRKECKLCELYHNSQEERIIVAGVLRIDDFIFAECSGNFRSKMLRLPSIKPI